MTRRHWWLGVTHGVAWKLASLAAKAGFLFVLAPALAPGEFAAYVFYSTVALVLGRFAACGVSDQLVLEVRGGADAARRFHPVHRRLFVAALVLFGLGLAWDSPWARSLALAGILVAGALLEGVVRSVWPARYEQLTNGPPILFFLLVVLSPARRAVDLLAMYGAAMLAFQAWLAVRSGFWSARGAVPGIGLAELAGLCRRGFAKMVAEMTLLLNMRGLILWPKVLGGGLASDSVSLALAIGEAASTLPMVVVNRNFARYASVGAKARRALGWALLVIVGMGLAGLAALAGWALVPERIAARLEATDLAWALLLYGAVTAYYDLRYLAWSRAPGTGRFTAWQLGFFLLQGLIVASLAQTATIAAVALAATLLVLGWIGWGYLRGSPPPGRI